MSTHGLTIGFGKHKGELFTRLPVAYLRWMVNEQTAQADIAAAELARRGTVLPDLEISGHAIDRASLRVRKVWHHDRADDEGLHAWLCRVSAEVLAAGPLPTDGKVKHPRLPMALVFEAGTHYPTLKTVIAKGKLPKEDA